MKEENGAFVVDFEALALQDRSFCVYEDIKIKLMKMGIPEKEIAFIHDAATDDQKEKMFAAVRSGDIRILLGSTQKMGAGTNAQTRLIALHHVDCPYRPSDLEQREGRIVRQGNTNPEVQIYQYVTKNSFDAYLWQIVESKQRFISQVMTGKNPSREMEDVSETVLNYAEVKAIATGNPLIKRKMELDIEVQRLRVLESQYRASKYSLEDNVLKFLPMELSSLNDKIGRLESDVALRDANGGGFYMRLGKHEFTEKKEAGETLLKAVYSGQYVDKVIGTYRGFEIIPQERNNLTELYKIKLLGRHSHTVELSGSDTGSITRIENAINGIEAQILENREMVEDIKRQMESSKAQLQRPFEHEELLQITLSELEHVNAELDVDKGGDADAVMDDAPAKHEDFLGLNEESEDEDEPEV